MITTPRLMKIMITNPMLVKLMITKPMLLKTTTTLWRVLSRGGDIPGGLGGADQHCLQHPWVNSLKDEDV